ncbi:MAG: preprotein translocase subunit SecG [Puniceicoccaceae bacterium]
MLTIVINLLTFVLILISLFLVLVILMQRANSNAGMGSAFGGGVTESTFGAETTNVLERATKWAAFAFFILALVLYLLFMSREGAESKAPESDLPEIPVVEESVPAEPVTLPAEAGETIDSAVAEAEEVLNEAAAAAEEAASDLAEEPVPVTLPEPESAPTP